MNHQEISRILNILKAGSVANNYGRQRLSFFQTEVLKIAREFDALAVKNPSEAASHRYLVMELWSLLPCFCRHPADLQSSFPNLVPVLIRAMGDERYPNLGVRQRLVCDSSLPPPTYPTCFRVFF